MLIEFGIFILLILLALTVFLALIYFGIFEEIIVKVGKPPYPFGSRTIAYKRQQGKYSDAGSDFTEVCTLVPHLNSIGIFFDDPQPSNRTEEENNKCRYLVGCILNEDPQKEQVVQLLTAKGYSFGVLPEVDHVVHTTFPFKGIISVVVAVRRVYPEMKTFIREHNLCAHPGIEIYHGQSIEFIFPLAKQDQFYKLYDDESEENSSVDDSDDSRNLTNGSKSKRSDLNKKIAKRGSSSSSSFEEIQPDVKED